MDGRAGGRTGGRAGGRTDRWAGGRTGGRTGYRPLPQIPLLVCRARLDHFGNEDEPNIYIYTLYIIAMYYIMYVYYKLYIHYLIAPRIPPGQAEC